MGTINPSIAIDNPPVNAPGREVRAGLAAAPRQAAADAATGAFVIAGKGRDFSAGADIREYDKPAQPSALRAISAAIAAMPKRPAPLRRRLAGEGRGFASLS
jgi:3-hydroxyacyl-CoA dehydrogenase